MRFIPTLAVLALAVLALAACATSSEDAGPYDPFESVNRPIFAFNRKLDDYALKPAAKAYRTILPQFAQDGIRNFLNNLRSPLILANDALQGNGERAGHDFARFWMNTVLGLGGIIDVAGIHGLPYHEEDFGQTLGVWGIPAGPYVMLPGLGPSNVRDTIAYGAEWWADPVSRYFRGVHEDAAPYERAAAFTVDDRSRKIETYDTLEQTSLDYYATARSLYQQRRESLIRNED